MWLSTLALLGTLVSVITMGVGPAFQQSIVFYSLNVVDESIPAYASAATSYNGTTIGEAELGSFASFGTCHGR